MRGRHAAGPEYADRLDGSELACRRMRVVPETIAGTKRVAQGVLFGSEVVTEADQAVGVSPQENV